MNELSSKDLAWFRLANSNPPTGFYDFKGRFLKRFAIQDGWDKQEIERACHACEGSGQYLKDVECNWCNGSGIYDTREHWLRRYDLAGQIYHKPEDNGTVWHENGYRWPDVKNLIEGRIQHAAVDSRKARRAFYRLLLRHEPWTFHRRVCEAIKDRAYWFRTKLVWKLIRLRNKMDLFKAIPDDDIPW